MILRPLIWLSIPWFSLLVYGVLILTIVGCHQAPPADPDSLVLSAGDSQISPR